MDDGHLLPRLATKGRRSHAGLGVGGVRDLGARQCDERKHCPSSRRQAVLRLGTRIRLRVSRILRSPTNLWTAHLVEPRSHRSRPRDQISGIPHGASRAHRRSAALVPCTSPNSSLGLPDYLEATDAGISFIDTDGGQYLHVAADYFRFPKQYRYSCRPELVAWATRRKTWPPQMAGLGKDSVPIWFCSTNSNRSGVALKTNSVPSSLAQ